LLAAVAFIPAARGDDYFEQKKKELALQAQQTVAEVMSALETSKQLEKTDPAKARSVLQSALLNLADSRALDSKEYKDLQQRLQSRLKQVEQTLAGYKQSTDYSSKATADKQIQADKERQYKEMQVAQNKSSYDQAKDRIDGTKGTLDKYQSIKVTRDKNFVDTQLDIEKTAAKGSKEERITQYFIDKSEKRKQKLTKEEVALLKALNSTISVDFDKSNATVKDFLKFLDDNVPGLSIFIDEASMKEANVEYDTPIGIKAKKATVRTILKKVLSDLGLTYVIKDAAVQVITPEKVRDYLVTRAYPVQDLIAPFDNLRMNPYAQKAQMYQQAQMLMQMIVNMIEPASWQGLSERGYGTIFYDPATMSIIIRHTAEMHYQLGGGLSR
jgi:hypothetical protein